MDAKELTKWLKENGACNEALQWVRGMSFSEAWGKCEEPGWMIWYLDKKRPKGYLERSVEIQLFMCRVLYFFPNLSQADMDIRLCDFIRGIYAGMDMSNG
jgi:hypothetical protein